MDTEVVIVGSGVAGALCAYRLAQRGIRVVVLEAGPAIERNDIVKKFADSPTFDSSSGYPNMPWAPRPDWNSQLPNIGFTGETAPKLEYLRQLGGTTWHWSGTALRWKPDEFLARSKRGLGADWPISYAELEPYYAQAEHEMGVAGNAAGSDEPRSGPYPLPPVPVTYAEQQVARKLERLGISFAIRPVARNSQVYDGRPRCEGFSSCSPICPTGAQYAAQVHVTKAKNLGVTFFTDTRVDHVRPGAGNKIDKVVAVDRYGKEVTVTARIVVLAANGLETPRILLSSNQDRRAGIGNSSGNVGRYFMDHPGISCRMELPDAVYAGRGPESTLVCHDFRMSRDKPKHAGWTLSMVNRIRLQGIAVAALAQPLKPAARDDYIASRAKREIWFDLQFEQAPDADNRVSLDWQQRDSAGQPLLQLQYKYGPYEKAGFDAGRRILQNMASCLDATSCEIGEPEPRHHLMGTTRMGDDPSTAVVDRECRSHDHHNLFMLGSSVFPTAGTANPTLTIAALSLRAADAISKQMQTGG